jgi:cobalamin biosynthesis protein CobC
MPPASPIAHGGALAAAVKKYGGKKADWLDLSTGINPVSAPLPKLGSSVWQALPDADLMENCLSAARSFYRLSSKAALVAAPGVQAVIQLLPHLRPGEKAAILGPTYGEYANVFQKLGRGCRIINSIEDLQGEKVVIVVNPNNPDGRAFRSQSLLNLAKSLSSKGGLLVIDEAFCDLMTEISVAENAGMRGLLVLKSFGKFFGLAGVRLGFAAGHVDDIATLQNYLGPWAVSGPALEIGASCLSNLKLRAKISVNTIDKAETQLGLLEGIGFDVISNTYLFHLVVHPNAREIHEVLAKEHILTRIFQDNPNWLRFGLCKNSSELLRLGSGLFAALSTL